MAYIYKYSKNEIYIENKDKEKIAYISFPQVEEGVYCIDHTVVDEKLRGQGIGGELVHRAVAYIHNKKGKVTATCTYAKEWMAKNGVEENL